MAKILVIEDDELARYTVQKILEDANHEVVTANDGAEGVRSFRSTVVDVVITDIIMPEKEGIETIVELRRHDPGAKIIAISGGGRTGNLDFLWLAKQIGADRVLPKPFGPGDLCTLVEDCLAGTQSQRLGGD